MPDTLQRIEYEGVIHEFPADFTEADIAKALKSEQHGISLMDAVKNAPSTAMNLLSMVGRNSIDQSKQGMQQAFSGAKQLGTAEMGRMVGIKDNNAMGQGLSDLAGGAGNTVAPWLVPIAAVTAPISTVATMAGGASGGILGEYLANRNNASPGGTALSTTVGSILGGGLASRVPSILGRGLRKGAEGAAESALGTRPNDRGNGRTIGAALLDETSGLSPEAVGKSATIARDRLLGSVMAEVKNAKTWGSLKPTIDMLQQARQEAAMNRSMTLVSEIDKMISHLTTDPITGRPYSMGQTAEGLLRMKRGFGDEFTGFKLEVSDKATALGNKAYGSLDNSVDTIAPASQAANQKVSSLLPSINRARSAQASASLPQRTMGRVAARTGALLGAFGGGAMFGPAGAATGLLVPELLADPVAQMAVARAMNGASILMKPKLPLWMTGPVSTVKKSEKSK